MKLLQTITIGPPQVGILHVELGKLFGREVNGEVFSGGYGDALFEGDGGHLARHLLFIGMEVYLF